MLRGRGGRRRGPRRHARRGLPHPPRLRAGDPCRRRARLRRRGPGGLRRGCRVAPPGPPPAAGPADRPRPGGHPESPRRRHRASGRADARRARTRRPGPCLGRAVRSRGGDRDAPRDRWLGPPPGPGARTRATRGGGGLHADDRLGRAPDRGAGRDPLGRGAGSPRVGGAGRRGEHVVAGCPPRVGGREAGPHPMSWNRLRVPRFPRLTRFPSPRRFLSLRVLRVLLGRPRPPLATGRPGLPIAPPTRGGRARDQRAGGRPSGPGVVGRALPRGVSGPEVVGSAGSRASGAAGAAAQAPAATTAHAAADAPAAATAGAWKELVTLTVVLVGLSRLAEGPALWATAVLAFAAHVLATLEVLGAEAAADDDGVPVEALLGPGVAATAAIGALRLVPVGLLLVPGLFAAGCLVLAAVALERRMLGRAKGATADDRAALLSLALLVAFVAFSGIAAAIPENATNATRSARLSSAARSSAVAALARPSILRSSATAARTRQPAAKSPGTRRSHAGPRGTAAGALVAGPSSPCRRRDGQARPARREGRARTAEQDPQDPQGQEAPGAREAREAREARDAQSIPAHRMRSGFAATHASRASRDHVFATTAGSTHARRACATPQRIPASSSVRWASESIVSMQPASTARRARSGARSRRWSEPSISRSVPVSAAAPNSSSQARSRSSRARSPSIRPAGCPMTSTWGLRMAPRTRSVSWARGWRRPWWSDATTTSKAARTSSSKSSAPSARISSSQPWRMRKPSGGVAAGAVPASSSAAKRRFRPRTISRCARTRSGVSPRAIASPCEWSVRTRYA